MHQKNFINLIIYKETTDQGTHDTMTDG